jgi:flagellar biosynthetic protein FliS
MAGNTNSQYLEGKILTASQPRLHLMLLEGAQRQCRIAQQAGQAEYWGEFYASMDKLMAIMEELVRSVSDSKSPIAESLEEQYAFLYRELAASRFSLNTEKLAECMKLVDFERETWKQVCDKVDTTPASRPAIVAPHLTMDTGVVSEGFSFEA